MADNELAGGSQPSLLQGFVSSAALAPQTAGVAVAKTLPIARVVIESSVPHLDRPFDYLVPETLAQQAIPGVRVKVPFGAQELNGYLTHRLAKSPAEKLVPLHKVISPVPVLTPAVLAAAEEVAVRYAGSVSDVLRQAIPPRVAKLEAAYPKHTAPLRLREESVTGDGTVACGIEPDEQLFVGYPTAPAFLRHLRTGGAPRAVFSALAGFGAQSWPYQLAAMVAAVHASGRGAVVVVPDARDLDRLEPAVASALPEGSFVRLNADDGPTPRYRNFLALLSGSATIALGTRSAAFAPVANPGLFCIWDDGDDNHIERRAPYQHAREVLLLRANASQSSVVLAGHSRSTEAQRLVDSGWAAPLHPVRETIRAATARVINTSDTFESDRDPLAQLARLPERAWRTAQDALKRGPVLVQVARGGYAPALACQRCRESARCRHCAGPLLERSASTGSHSTILCRWCGTIEPTFSCQHCGSTALRRTVTGATRTAEELGKAFPGTTVISSTGDHVRATVPDRPALVVATVGGEPVAPKGYAAALLLDADALLRRESLRAGEAALRHWFNATALVRPTNQGGVVVLVTSAAEIPGYLVRWDPANFAARELAERTELGLPPAVRIASLTGSEAGVAAFMKVLNPGSEVRVVGPTVLPTYRGSEEPPEVRSLLFFSFAHGPSVTAHLRATKASLSARKSVDSVQVRVDGVDVL